MKQKIREILNRSQERYILSMEEEKFMFSIFENHPDIVQKIGIGVEFIFADKTIYGNRCFYFKRLDGSVTDISYVESLQKTSKIKKIKNACRKAIEPIILNYRDDNIIFGKTRCAITGDILNKNNTHVDHYDLSFNDLFLKWILDKDITKLFDSTCSTKDMQYGDDFIDDNVKNEFIKFHNRNTNLRAVTKKANLSILKT